METKMDKKKINLLDCTLRDGGYYNDWDFDPKLINSYLKAMVALPADMVEIGFRSMPGAGGKFKGGCAYCTDEYISSLAIPKKGLRLAVMVNGSDFLKYPEGVASAVNHLFCPAEKSPVELVRIASHVHQVEETLPAITRLNELGYKTTVNLMQIAGLSRQEVEKLSKSCSAYPIDILYFADSLGSMVQDDINQTVDALRTHWQGELGFHAHNNMEWALPNSLRAIELGVTWIDSTVLGMGRGPGNALTEYMAIEFENKLGRKMNYIPLLNLLKNYFEPLQQKYGWGPNPYYYMAGKYGIHPTYIQEMIGNTRFEGEDMLAVIKHLRVEGGKSYSLGTMEAARNFYSGEPRGTWRPAEMLKDREVLLLGAGPGVATHRKAVEQYIRKEKPFVMALNTQSQIATELINVRIASHPVRLLADCEEHKRLPQPLITPISMLPKDVKDSLQGKELLDFGLTVQEDTFKFHDTFCVIPNSLVFVYSLAVATSGKARRILLAGFDGYGADDPRTMEMEKLLEAYRLSQSGIELISITPTRYNLEIHSVYAM
jgi:4-hydroxy 2-oxovalerate aldolase